MLTDTDQRPERGLGGRHADTKIGERGFLDNGQRQADGADDQHRPHHIGQHVAQQDDEGIDPQDAGGGHVILLPLDHGGAAHGAGKLGPVGQADCQDQHPDGCAFLLVGRDEAARHAEDQQGNQDGRKAQLHIGDAHDDGIPDAAQIAGDQAQPDPHDHGEQRGREADKQRNPRAIHNGREHIAALIVGAQNEVASGKGVGVGRREAVHQIQGCRIERVIWSNPGGEHRH